MIPEISERKRENDFEERIFQLEGQLEGSESESVHSTFQEQ